MVETSIVTFGTLSITDANAFAHAVVGLDDPSLLALQDRLAERDLLDAAGVVYLIRQEGEESDTRSILMSRLSAVLAGKEGALKGALNGAPTGLEWGRTSVRDDEDRFAGPEWRRVLLPQVLQQFGYAFNDPVDAAHKVLLAPSAHRYSSALKAVALRVIGDHLRELGSVERLLATLEVIADILEKEQEAPMLKAMALVLLHQINRPPVDVTLIDFSLKNFFAGAFGRNDQQALLINGRSAPAADLQANADRIKALKARIFPLLGREREKNVGRWNGAWPGWYALLPGLFPGNEAYFQSGGILADRRINGLQRALALAYYAFVVQAHYPTPPGSELLSALLKSDEPPLLKVMAAAVSTNFARLAKESRPAVEMPRTRWLSLLRRRFLSR